MYKEVRTFRESKPTKVKAPLGKLKIEESYKAVWLCRNHKTYNIYTDMWGIYLENVFVVTLHLTYKGKKFLNYRSSYSSYTSEVDYARTTGPKIVKILTKNSPSEKMNNPTKKVVRFSFLREMNLNLAWSHRDKSTYTNIDNWCVKLGKIQIGHFSITKVKHEPEPPFVSNAEINSMYRKRGIGKKVYVNLAKIYKTIESDQHKTSEAAFRVWRSLKAERVQKTNNCGSYRYRLVYK